MVSILQVRPAQKAMLLPSLTLTMLLNNNPMASCFIPASAPHYCFPAAYAAAVLFPADEVKKTSLWEPLMPHCKYVGPISMKVAKAMLFPLIA